MSGVAHPVAAIGSLILSKTTLTPEQAGIIAERLAEHLKKRLKETRGVEIQTKVCYQKCVKSFWFGTKWEEACDSWQRYEYSKNNVKINWFSTEADAAPYVMKAYEEALRKWKAEHNQSEE